MAQAQLDSVQFWKMFGAMASATQTSSEQNKSSPTTPMQDVQAQVKPKDSDDETAVTSKISFRGQQMLVSHSADARVAFFVRRFTFAYVRDLSLRMDIARITNFDEENWEWEAGTHVYRLADLTCLLHRLTHDSELQQNEHHEELQKNFSKLSGEIDRMHTPGAQVELSLSRDLAGPSEWLQYFYWCHIVSHMQPMKGFVVRVDQQGRISPVGEPKAASILGARQIAGGIVLCCGWRWGSDTVLISDLQHLNYYGIYFSDHRLQSSALLRGWAAQMLNAPMRLGDIYWEVNHGDITLATKHSE